jgi:hypothetical protein
LPLPYTVDEVLLIAAYYKVNSPANLSLVKESPVLSVDRARLLNDEPHKERLRDTEPFRPSVVKRPTVSTLRRIP